MITIDYTVDDIEKICICFDSLMLDRIYAQVMTGKSASNYERTQQVFEVRYNSNVKEFLHFLEKESSVNNIGSIRALYSALSAPFDQLPLKLGNGGLFRSILECRLRLGK